jgi:hypothetical protein
MGRDISIIHNHNLDISNVETLAHDLAARFDINIEYGYYAPFRQESLVKLLGHKYSDDETILGKIKKSPEFQNFRLRDTNYFEKMALERFGEKIFYEKILWEEYSEFPSVEEIIDTIREARSIDYDLESYDGTDFRDLTVFKDCLMNGMYKYFSRWWFLCYLFSQTTKTDIAYNDVHVINFRKELQFYSSKLGANFIYYVDDQSNVLEGLGEGSRGEMSWEEIQTFVKEKCGDLLLNIPEYFLNENYRKMWIDRKQEPLAFVDDFRDLKSF